MPDSTWYPEEEEARRNEALNHAIFSTETGRVSTQQILDRAQKFEEWLKNGTEVNVNQDMPFPQPKGAFGAYQERGLDADSTET